MPVTFWLWLFAISLVISHMCRRKLKAQRVSRNAVAHAKSGPRYEQDRPYPECFDEMEDDL